MHQTVHVRWLSESVLEYMVTFMVNLAKHKDWKPGESDELALSKWTQSTYYYLYNAQKINSVYLVWVIRRKNNNKVWQQHIISYLLTFPAAGRGLGLGRAKPAVPREKRENITSGFVLTCYLLCLSASPCWGVDRKAHSMSVRQAEQLGPDS